MDVSIFYMNDDDTDDNDINRGDDDDDPGRGEMKNRKLVKILNRTLLGSPQLECQTSNLVLEYFKDIPAIFFWLIT